MLLFLLCLFVLYRIVALWPPALQYQLPASQIFCVLFVFVAPALARCDIDVRFFRQSIRPSFGPQFTSNLAFKSIQMMYSLKLLHPWILNYICSMIRLQGFRIVKISLVENSRWPPLLKIAKLIKSSFSPERLGIFGWNFVWGISRTLVLIGIKMKKSLAELGHKRPFKNLRRP